MEKGELVSIKTYGNELDAQVAKQHLESHGIEALITKDDCGGMRPWLQYRQGITLQVFERDVQEANTVLKAM